MYKQNVVKNWYKVTYRPSVFSIFRKRETIIVSAEDETTAAFKVPEGYVAIRVEPFIGGFDYGKEK